MKTCDECHQPLREHAPYCPRRFPPDFKLHGSGIELRRDGNGVVHIRPLPTLVSKAFRIALAVAAGLIMAGLLSLALRTL